MLALSHAKLSYVGILCWLFYPILWLLQLRYQPKWILEIDFTKKSIIVIEKMMMKQFFSVKSKYIKYIWSILYSKIDENLSSLVIFYFYIQHICSILYSKIDGNLSYLVIFLLLGSIGQICHVQKVNHLLHLIDPNTCQGMFRTIFRYLTIFQYWNCD